MSGDGARPSVALVLGAGGVAGGAWHAAVLGALHEAAWDARGAELVIGTSAGAGMAAALRLGLSPRDMLAGPMGRSMSEEGAEYAARAGGPVEIPRPSVGGRFRPASPGLVARAAARPARLRPMTVMAGLLPEGQASTKFIGDRIRRTHDQPWPDRPTWICAARLADGARVVFGRDVTDAHLAIAVEASSAIPGYFAPVDHGPHRYIDGGVHSPTNADLVAGLDFDLVVVSSPMSATSSAIRRFRWTGARALHRATLGSEVRAVRSSGTAVLVLQPGPRVVDVIGVNTMDTSRRSAIVEAAYEEITTYLRSDRVADRLAVLAG